MDRRNASPRGSNVKRTRWYANWWDKKPSRLVTEKESMEQSFPGFELKKLDDRLGWYGTLTSNRGNEYSVAVVYPKRYPNPDEAPKAYITDPEIDPPKHAYKGGDGPDRLCLFSQFDSQDRSWREGSTASVVVSWVATWIFAYEHYLETGHWPGPEAD